MTSLNETFPRSPSCRLSASRASAARSMSTSVVRKKCGMGPRDVASRLAIVLRIWVRGTSWYGAPSTAGAAAGERGAGSGSIRCAADGGDADVPVAAVRSRSFLTTRPPGPDPVTSLRSTPASLAMRRASRVAFPLMPFHQAPFLHGRGERFHEDLGGHYQSR